MEMILFQMKSIIDYDDKNIYMKETSYEKKMIVSTKNWWFENQNIILIDKLNRFIDRNEIDKGCENYMKFQYESKRIHLLQIDMNDK